MQRFILTEEHIKLLRRAYVSWDDCEFGAPSIDPKRPYGNGDVVRDIAEILGEKAKTCPRCGESLEAIDDERYRKLHTETQSALQIVLATGAFEPGAYEAEDYTRDWRKAERSKP